MNGSHGPFRIATAVLALALAAPACSNAEPSGSSTSAAPTTAAVVPLTCDGSTGLHTVRLIPETSDDVCEAWIDAALGRAVLGSTGSATVWTRNTPNGTALVVGAIHTLGEGWFGPSGTAIQEALIDPGTTTGVLRLYLFLPDGSGPGPLASPLFEFFNPSVASERNGNRMQDVLPREDFFVVVTDSQKFDVSGPVPVPEPVGHGPVALYDPLDVTLAAPTFAGAVSGSVVLLLGYPNTTREPTAAFGRILDDDEAVRVVARLAELGDPEGAVPYDAEVEMIIEGAAAAGMSGGPVVDRNGRLVGVLVRASDEHDGVQYVRAVRMTYVTARVTAAFELLPPDVQQVVAGYLEG